MLVVMLKLCHVEQKVSSANTFLNQSVDYYFFVWKGG